MSVHRHGPRRHAWGIFVSPALSLQACSPASHNTSPCPAPDLTAREVATGCRLTRAQNSTAAGSGVILRSSFFPVQLLTAPSREQGRVGCICKAGSKASPACAALQPCCPQCPVCPQALLHCKSPPHTSAGYSCQSSTGNKPLPDTLPSARSKCLISHLPQTRSLTMSLYFWERFYTFFWERNYTFPWDPVPPVVSLQHFFLHPEPCLLVKFLTFLQMLFGRQ